MKLFENPDFEQAILRAADHFRDRGLRPAIIEKDYHVTEALRILAVTAPDKIIFKGGTSLAKGWNLIQRFSEDIDIFFDPLPTNRPWVKTQSTANSRSSAMLSDHTRRSRLSRRRAGPSEVSAQRPFFLHATLRRPRRSRQSRPPRSRHCQRARTPSIARTVLISRTVLEETGTSMGAEDEGRFPLRLLHFRRTFVEKMFAIHGKAEMLKREGQPLGTYARHYYDLIQLAAQTEVIDMLKSTEYAAIKADYDEISRTHFPKSYSHPEGMNFAKSDALFPPRNSPRSSAPNTRRNARCSADGPYLSWAEVQKRFLEIETSCNVNIGTQIVST